MQPKVVRGRQLPAGKGSSGGNVFYRCTLIVLSQDKLVSGSLQGSTSTDLSFLLQERDATIESLQATLDQREEEKLTHQEELTELRR